jgi:hypothetical protein
METEVSKAPAQEVISYDPEFEGQVDAFIEWGETEWPDWFFVPGSVTHFTA